MYSKVLQTIAELNYLIIFVIYIYTNKQKEWITPNSLSG